MELTEKQQEQWLNEYIKHEVMTKLTFELEQDYYAQVDFDAYAAYEYLNKVCNLEEWYYSWVIGDMKVIIDVDDSVENDDNDLTSRRAYLENKVIVPEELNEDEITFAGLMHLAKVIGCDPGSNNFNDMGDDEIYRDSLLVSRFPINENLTFIVIKIDAQFDDSSGIRILY